MKSIYPNIAFRIAFLILILTVQSSLAAESQNAMDPGVSPKLEKAIIAERWDTVSDLLKNVTPKTPSPVLRLIKGHAQLAQNWNNESVCLFLSASNPDDIKEWDEWTSKFEKLHDGVLVGRYLRGDALARLGAWDGAEAAFRAVLVPDKNPKHVLSLNALGLVHAARQDWDGALVEFTMASKLRPDFADATASLGAYWVQKKDGAQGALKALDKAIKSSRDTFALARYGRGNILMVLGKFDQAAKDFNEALNSCELLQAQVRSNIIAMLERIQKTEEEQNQLVAELEQNPGTAIETRFIEICRAVKSGDFGGPMGNLNTLNKIMLSRPELRKVYAEEMKDISSPVNNRLQSTISQRLASNQNFWKTVGGLTGSLDFKPKGVGVGVEYDFKNIADHKARSGNNPAWNVMRNLLPQPRPTAGFATSLAEATWDKGNWPFDATYSLGYQFMP